MKTRRLYEKPLTFQREHPIFKNKTKSSLSIRIWNPILDRSTTIFLLVLEQYQNQCCGSGMFIPDPDFNFLHIPDPGYKNSNN
jgi:hypothetical protein